MRTVTTGRASLSEIEHRRQRRRAVIASTIGTTIEKEIILTALLRMAEQAPFYIFTAFVFTYGTRVPHGSRDLLLAAVLVASIVSFFTIPIAEAVSDRIGRRRMYLIGAATMGVYTNRDISGEYAST